jgi:hypothetical protein
MIRARYFSKPSKEKQTVSSLIYAYPDPLSNSQSRAAEAEFVIEKAQTINKIIPMRTAYQFSKATPVGAVLCNKR